MYDDICIYTYKYHFPYAYFQILFSLITRSIGYSRQSFMGKCSIKTMCLLNTMARGGALASDI